MWGGMAGTRRPDGALNTSVNSLDRSNSQEYCVTGDNYSLVKLFNYPCVHDDAPWREFYGGASFITCVRFRCALGLRPRIRCLLRSRICVIRLFEMSWGGRGAATAATTDACWRWEATIARRSSTRRTESTGTMACRSRSIRTSSSATWMGACSAAANRCRRRCRRCGDHWTWRARPGGRAP